MTVLSFVWLCFVQFVMELTQFLEKVCRDDNLRDMQPETIDELKRKLLHFSDDVPQSVLVQKSSSIRAAFIRIFDKYIANRAEWKVHLDAGTQNKLLPHYRRLKELKKYSYTELHTPPGALTPDTMTTSTLSTPSSSRDEAQIVMPVASPASINGIGRANSHRQFNMNLLTILDGAVDLLMNEVVGNLESSFKEYQETKVMIIYIIHVTLTSLL